MFWSDRAVVPPVLFHASLSTHFGLPVFLRVHKRGARQPTDRFLPTSRSVAPWRRRFFFSLPAELDRMVPQSPTRIRSACLSRFWTFPGRPSDRLC